MVIVNINKIMFTKNKQFLSIIIKNRKKCSEAKFRSEKSDKSKSFKNQVYE